MASEEPKKLPGKLKFNASMFNPGAMKPGAKNKKLEELKQKRQEAPTQPLNVPDDQFSRPNVPRRRGKSKHKLDLDEETKKDALDTFYNQSFITPNTDDNTTNTKHITDQDTETKDNTEDIHAKLNSALKSRQDPASMGYMDPNKVSPVIQKSVKKLEHQKKADNINKQLEARQDIETMVDQGLIPADPRKVHGSLQEPQNQVSQQLADRASKEYLQRTNILKHPKIDASIQPMADNLEKELQHRSPRTPGFVDDNIAPKLAAKSKELDRSLKSDKVSKGLKDENRSSLTKLQEQGVLPVDPNKVASSLAATSKQLDHQFKSDKLSQALTDDDRKTREQLTEKGVIKYPNLSSNLIENANKLEKQQIEDKLKGNLENRSTVDDLANSRILTSHPEQIAPSMHSAANELQKQVKKDQLHQGLRDRQTLDDLTQSNILTSNPEQIAPSMHGAANELQKQMQKDQLHKGLRERQDVHHLTQSNILTSHPEQVAPSMHGAANELQKQMQKDQLSKNLRDRSSVDDLAQSNILTSHPDDIAPSIHGTANQLQKELQKDQLSKNLRDRQTTDDLTQSNILTSHPQQVAPSMHGAANELQKQMHKDQLHKGLRERQDVDDLTQSNILTSNPEQIAPSIHGTANELQKQLQKDQLSRNLKDRQTADDLTHSNILTSHPQQIAPSMHSAANQLQKQIHKDQLNKGLRDRQTTDDLTQSNILTSNPEQIAPSIHGTANELQKQIHKDQLQKGLRDRQTPYGLAQSNILTSNPSQIAPSMHSAANQLQKQIHKDQLHKGLRDRQDVDDLTQSNILTSNPEQIAPSIHGTANELQKQIHKDQLQKGLRDRQGVDDLTQSNILTSDPEQIAPIIHGAANELQKQIHKDQLHKGLRDRQDVGDLTQSNILTSNPSQIAPSMHGTANELQKQMHKDQLQKGLRDRQGVDDLTQSNILTSDPEQIAPIIHGAANELQKQIHKDQLNRGLRDRQGVDDLTQSNILTSNPEQVAPAIHSTANQLQKEIQKDQLSKNLRGREELDTLHNKNIITPNVAPQIAAKQRELDYEVKVDLLKDKLDDPERPEKHDLHKADILYSETMAPSLQSNAKDLEEKMREIEYKQNELETTSSPSNEQSPDATDIEEEERRVSSGIHDDNNQPAAHLTKQDIQRNRNRVSRILNTRLNARLRKTPDELTKRGILPNDYFDDPQGAYEMRLIQRKLAKEDLKRQLKDRTPAKEIVQRGIAHDEFWRKSPDEIRKDKRKERKEYKKKLNEKLNRERRPSVHDLVAKQIMPEDSEVIQELKNIAQSHRRMESAVKDLSARLPFEEETNLSVAETMMKHINATEDDVQLQYDTDDLFSDEEQNKTRESEEESEQDPDIDYDASSDIEANDNEEISFDLERHQKQNRKRRLSQNMEHFLKHQPDIKELEDRGLLKQTALAHSLRGPAVALEERMNNMPSRSDLVTRNILKRPSISRSLQPNAEALELELIKNLAKLNAKELKLERVTQNNHPLFKRDNDGKGRGHQRRNSGFGTKKNQNPEYYKHDIAPKLQGVANKLHIRRLSQTIESRLNARPTKQELVDQRILYKESMAHQLQGNAMQLEEQLRQRVPEKYLQMIGVLIHDQESVAPKIQGASYELEYALRRRPSLFDGANQDIVKILGIPSDHNDHHEFYTNELFRDVPRTFTPNQDNEPLSISAFEEMYPDDNDKTNYRLRRARNSDKLEKRMSRRMSQQDLIKVGIIPVNYFEDPQEAIEMQHIRRKLAAEDLKRGLKNRSTVDELVQRGLTRYEYFNMDMVEARKEIAKHSKNTKKQVELQLNSIFNPQLIELEKRGIVEEGYFMTRAKQIEEGHRRLPSVTAELQQKLLSNPSYNEELAKTLVQDLRSDSEDDDDDDYDSDDSDDNDSSDDDMSDTDSDDFMDSDDEEQARRLQELEYKIGHRPSTDELIEKRILYKKISDMAPSIQNAAKNLQSVIAKRPSLLEVSEKGILLAATNQDQLDTSSVLKKKKKKKKKKRKENKYTLQNMHLNKKLGRRRPTMVDLETQGIVPRGYFNDVENAMSEKKIRKENIITDLTTRLQGRPEFSESLASKLINKALTSFQQKQSMVASGKNEKDQKVIGEILTAKLTQRMGVNQLKAKNILSQNYSPQKSTKLTANADALQRHHLKQKLAQKLGSRQTEDEVLDTGYLKYKGHGHHGLSATYQPVAAELEPLIKTRVDERYLQDKGIIYPERKRLNEAIKSRPDPGHLEDSGIVPHGAFEDLDAAQQAKHDRQQSIHDELNAFFETDRRSKEELIEKGVFSMPQKRRGSVEIKADDDCDTDDESIYNSPDIPPVPDRSSSMFQTNTYTEIVMNSITFHNKKAIEPSYSIDLLVAEPDLTDDVIQTSTLSFLNVLDNLNEMVAQKIQYASDKYILPMKAKSTDLVSLKNLLRNLQQYGLAIVNEEFDGIELFESCGDLDADIDNVWKEIMKRQEELYKMDNEYIGLHIDIRSLQNVKNDLADYCDKYKIQLSQLKRVQQRISSYICENKMTKDSSNEAMKATDSNQAWMISKITNKIVKLQNKMDGLPPNSDELVTCSNFLNGLEEFLVGLKKLRKSSSDKIQHLQCIIEKLKEQEKDIVFHIAEIRQNAINKLAEIRNKYVGITDQVENKYNDHDDDDSGISDLSQNNDDDIDIVDFSSTAPLSMLELMHKREKYMTKVYKKIHDLESRAQTTSSTDYLRGLTEIRELQIILNNPSLKYFYNHFVSSCNEIFNDCCLANQAILENTAEINTPLLAQLKGIQLLNDVLNKNKGKLNEENTVQLLETIVVFVQSLPDREVVIMQIARHLSLSLPFRSFIVGDDEIVKEREKRKRLQLLKTDEKEENVADNEHHLIKIDKFIKNKIREWIGSILNIYGNNAFSSVRVALESDVVAQVRPSYAARLIVNCVYGLDVSL